MDGGERSMKRSLQRRLTLMLGIAVLVSGLVAAIISFFQAYTEAKEFQDNTLRQIGLLVSRSAAPPSLPHRFATHHGKIRLGDHDARIDVIHLPADARPGWLGEDLPTGLSTQETRGDQLRVFVFRDASGKTTIVTQPTDVRDDIAIDSALRTFAPLIFFLPIMAWLIMRIVRGELTPIRKLAGHLDAQSTGLPMELPDREIPDEILPFIQAINRLFRRVANLMGQQRRFVADAAHELRSPLAALTLQVQNLQHAGSPESLKERILFLQDGLERTRKLSEQLLSLARIQAGTEKVTTVDVSAMSRMLIADYLSTAEARGIDLGLEEKVPLKLPGTEENFYLILKNALENALQHTAAGGVVTIRLLATDEAAGFEVVDNGPGIPTSEQKRVFDPFYRLSGASGEGSGLGLAIVTEAAACLGGTVSLLNRQEGSGLIFRYRQMRF
jgi:two-component system, OmpR family, sensor kinase